MSGNTRGKLKEHFQGVHKNLGWCVHHLNKSAILIEQQLIFLPGFEDTAGDAEKQHAFFMKHPMYQAVTSLTEGLQTFDELAKDIYDQV